MGGNYASAFVKSMDKTAHDGHNIMNKRTQGLSSAPNPSDSQVPLMKILGSTEWSRVFPPEDHVQIVAVSSG